MTIQPNPTVSSVGYSQRKNQGSVKAEGFAVVPPVRRCSLNPALLGSRSLYFLIHNNMN